MTTHITPDFGKDEEVLESDMLIEYLMQELDDIELELRAEEVDEPAVDFEEWTLLRRTFTSAMMVEPVAEAVDDLLVGVNDTLNPELVVRLERRASFALALRELSSGFFETMAAAHRLNQGLELGVLAERIDSDVAHNGNEDPPVMGSEGAALLNTIEQGEERISALKEEQTARWISVLGIEVSDSLDDSLFKSLRRSAQPAFAGPQENEETDQAARAYVDKVMTILRDRGI
jgi:hypothetical protein